jgi:hypothetical protein
MEILAAAGVGRLARAGAAQYQADWANKRRKLVQTPFIVNDAPIPSKPRCSGLSLL